MISVTILGRENQILMPRRELMQRETAIGGFDEKLGSLQADFRTFNGRIPVS
jgi:hypothetical protein